jgi:hypothetical protein
MSLGGVLLVSLAILFLSMTLFIYWSMRVLLLIRRSEEEVNQVLDYDVFWGRRLCLLLSTLFSSSPQFL